MRLTRLGWGVGATGLVFLVLGIVLGVPVVAAIGAFMLVLRRARCSSWRRPTVKLARVAVPAEAERGAPAEVRLHFQSTSTSGRARSPRSRPSTGEPRAHRQLPADTPPGTDHVTYASRPLAAAS